VGPVNKAGASGQERRAVVPRIPGDRMKHFVSHNTANIGTIPGEHHTI
jgi:hypothetical protein